MTGALTTRRDVPAPMEGIWIPPTDERPLRDDDRAPLALAMLLLGEGTVTDLRSCGLDCQVADVARVAEALPELSIVATIEGFRCGLPMESLAEALPRLADGGSELVLRAVRILLERGSHRRAAMILGTLMDVVDVGPIVCRHAFDFLNVGEVELVENVVFDEAFGAPEWLREALSGVEGILWAGLRGYRQQAKRGRQVSLGLLARSGEGTVEGDGIIPMAQAWSLLDLYGSWDAPVQAAVELPTDLCDDADDLLRCLWTLRRCRQLMALGHLDGALRLLEAAMGLVEADSIVGAHLRLDRFLCLTLLGRSSEEDLRCVRAASEYARELHLELLSLTIDGYLAAALAYTGSSVRGREPERLLEKSELHPDPILSAALAIGCAANAYRRHSFYTAFVFVRDLSVKVAYMGSTDLVCCAYCLEALCQAAMGEETRPIGEPEEGRPSVLGFHLLARTIYGVTQEVYDVACEIDPKTPFTLMDGVEPSHAAQVLVGLALRGPWRQANALRDLLPGTWLPRRPEEFGRLEGAPWPSEVADGAVAVADGARPRLRLVPDAEDVPVLPRVTLTNPPIPKLTLRMLGDFEIYLGERRLTDDCWRRKAGKLLLQALVVAPGHTLSRADLCELIWPDRDFIASRNHLYSVLSSTRDALGCVAMDPPYLICEQGKVSLNGRLSECDVDLFTRRCHDVIARLGDAPWRLSLCRELCRRYAGGLYVPSQDVRGEFQARRRALETLYVDMLVEAADLALKCGLSKEALWFTSDALKRDSLREDVVANQLRALSAEGRGHEMERAYERYRSELSEGLFMAPSARIRTLHEELRDYISEAVVPRDEAIQSFERALDNVA